MEEQNSSNTPPSSSFLDPIREALARMQAGEAISPDVYRNRSASLLNMRFGENGAEVRSGFAHGMVGIQADHSHYFNGFALLKPMRHGTSVSLRSTDSGIVRVAIEGNADVVEFEPSHLPVDTESTTIRLLQSLLESNLPEMSNGIEVAIVSTIPQNLESSYLASLGVAISRALEEEPDDSQNQNDRARTIKQAVESVLKYPFSIAYIVAAAAESPIHFTLVDTESLEYLPLEVGEGIGPGWALIDTSSSVQPSIRSTRHTWSEEILSSLQNKKFSTLTSFRDLEHRDMETATSLLPRKMKHGVRYLVSENRRVQRLVAAIRNGDWQLLGALLLMSHASRRDDWSITSPIQNFVVEQAERFSIEGVYGATQTGEGSFVLIAGQPVGLPAFLDHLRSSWPAQASDGPRIYII